MTGVIAQDVQRVLPDAVSTSGPCTLANGEEIDNVLIVDKDRLFLGTFGWPRVFPTIKPFRNFIISRAVVYSSNYKLLNVLAGTLFQLQRASELFTS